jgi:hypothetical protein
MRLAQTLVQLVEEPTRTGTRLWLVVPSPSWPAQLFPQDHRLPSRFNARLCGPAVATCFQSSPGTERTGRACSRAVVPSPNWPWSGGGVEGEAGAQHCTQHPGIKRGGSSNVPSPTRYCGARVRCGWVTRVSEHDDYGRNPVGVADVFGGVTQGSSFLATPGWRTQSLWDCRPGHLQPTYLASPGVRFFDLWWAL